MKKKLAPIFLILFLGAVYTSYLVLRDYESITVQLWNLLPPLCASLCAIFTLKIYGKENPHAKALAFLALGIFFWFLGDFIWFIFEFFYNLHPFPSVADLFYLLAYPSLLAGLILEFKNNKMCWTRLRLTICISKSIIFALIVLYFGIIKAYNPEVAMLNNLIAMSYGVGDLVLIMLSSSILLITFNYRRGKLFLPWIFIFIGFSLILVSDILFAIYKESYENLINPLRNLDLGWITGFSFLAFGFYKIGEALEETKRKLLGLKTCDCGESCKCKKN